MSGSVASREAKRRAEDVVDGISGVKHVQNNLRVQPVSASANWSASASSTAEGGTINQAGTADRESEKL